MGDPGSRQTIEKRYGGGKGINYFQQKNEHRSIGRNDLTNHVMMENGYIKTYLEDRGPGQKTTVDDVAQLLRASFNRGYENSRGECRLEGRLNERRLSRLLNEHAEHATGSNPDWIGVGPGVGPEATQFYLPLGTELTEANLHEVGAAPIRSYRDNHQSSWTNGPPLHATGRLGGVPKASQRRPNHGLRS